MLLRLKRPLCSHDTFGNKHPVIKYSIWVGKRSQLHHFESLSVHAGWNELASLVKFPLHVSDFHIRTSVQKLQVLRLHLEQSKPPFLNIILLKKKVVCGTTFVWFMTQSQAFLILQYLKQSVIWFMFAESEVSTSLLLEIQGYWTMTLCSFGKRYPFFGRNCCIHLHGLVFQVNSWFYITLDLFTLSSPSLYSILLYKCTQGSW